MISNPTFHFIKIISLDLILLLSLGGLLFAQDNTGQANQSLRRELSRMLNDDQKYRKTITDAGLSTPASAENEKRVSELWEKQNKLDKRNIKKLAAILKKHGWPMRSAVGKEGSLAAFLVVQHGDLEYQKKYFP